MKLRIKYSADLDKYFIYVESSWWGSNRFADTPHNCYNTLEDARAACNEIMAGKIKENKDRWYDHP